jgi:xylulokinase
MGKRAVSGGRRILACDLGTGGNKASLYDAEGVCLASAFVPYETIYPRSGWHEQRPEDWWHAVVESIRRLLSERVGEAGAIECISISGHSLGAVPLDAGGRLLRESTPIWSDTRAEAEVRELFRKLDERSWYMRTGNGFPPACYTIFKILWYRNHEPDMFGSVARVVGTKDYINYRLTGTILTDHSYASGSGVYDLAAWGYAPELIEATGLPREIFPDPVASTRVIGELRPEAAGELGLSRTVKVVCGGVDNSCMALGARNIAEGRVYTSLGSSSWIAVSARQPVLEPERRPFVFTHVIPGMYTSAVSIFAAGSSLRWVRDTLCPDLAARAQAEGRDPYEVMTELAARSPIGARGLLFNPSLAGGTSQEASPHVRGAFAGLDLGHRREDLIRACLEGIALNLGAVLELLRGYVAAGGSRGAGRPEAGTAAAGSEAGLGAGFGGEMVMVGGGSRSPLWLQIFADVYEMDVLKTNVDQDAGSLGAAALGAVGCGLWPDFGRIDSIHEVQARYRPVPERVQAYRALRPAFEALRESQAGIGDMIHALQTQDSHSDGVWGQAR